MSTTELLKKISEQLSSQNKRFDDIEKKIDSIEAKLILHDDRFSNIETKLDLHDDRFSIIETKLEQFDDIEENIQKEIRQLNSRIHGVEMNRDTDRKIEQLSEVFFQKPKGGIQISPGGSRIHSAICGDEEIRDQPSFS